MSLKPHLLLVGTSHRSAPLGYRECMTLSPERKQTLHQALETVPDLNGFLLLCTCNRVELYASAFTEEPVHQAQELFCQATGLLQAGVERYGYTRKGVNAVVHLMEVCAGLDSQMIGETEILGQVKQAYAQAAEGTALDATLHRVFQKSFQAAKWARQNSGVGQGQISLGAVSVELARRIHGDLSKSRILVVGSGQVGADVARAMQVRGAGEMFVTSRTETNARQLAETTGARMIPFESWTDALPKCDIAILCTASPAPLLQQEQVRRAMRRRVAEPLFLIDLAMPRDVEPSVAEINDVFLYTFEDLAKVANQNRKGRMEEVAQCQKMIAERAQRLWENLQNAATKQPTEPKVTTRADESPNGS